ncbi:hypothetical protein KC19_4G144600 [Ceratodon purpureus]|uniref:Uncharacterized protein n=1 Tax=Ceratodon purpureus TaxID=3225 RepID=A0A8T0IAN6_CERPU|nr:hypothetical protein KC19_4G144600 [Ceratodon purpureus]
MASKLQLVLLVGLVAVLFHAVESGRVLHETESNPSAPTFEGAGGEHSTEVHDQAVPEDTRADAEYARSLAIRELSVTVDGDAVHGVMKPRRYPPPPPMNPYHP